MLRHLRVTNFAILSDVEIELGAGMNVLTGETGAGKSLIVEAVNLLRGGRASADIPRAGADEAVVEAIVEVPRRSARARRGRARGRRACRRGDEGDEVFIRRVIQRGGRSRCYVNGALTTAARLAELGALLIDLSGQHQHQGLVDPARHLEILDAVLAARPASSSRRWTRRGPSCGAATTQLAALGGDEREREARVDYLRFQLEELDGAALRSRRGRRDRDRARAARVGRSAAGRGAHRRGAALRRRRQRAAIASPRRRARSSARCAPIRRSSRSRASSPRSRR